MNSVHCSRCVCAHCSKSVHTWMGQMQRTNFTAGYSLLCIIMYVTTKKQKKNQNRYFFFSKPITDNGKMLKYREKYR